MASDSLFVLPGDRIDPSLIPSHPNKALRLGPGLRHEPPDTLIPTLAGQLITDRHKNAMHVETSRGRYLPRVGERVIGTVLRSAAEVYYVLLSDHTAPVLLPQLAFESATRKTRPMLAPGALVYARVSLANRHMDAELECVSATMGKADGLGPLNGGMLFRVSLGMARRLMMPRAAEDGLVVVLEELAGLGLHFETATGRNGRLWVDSEDPRTVIAVGRAVQHTDRLCLSPQAQKKLARKLHKEIN